jgi:hypothetical protein
MNVPCPVIPTKAGIPLLLFRRIEKGSWIPAFAEMTVLTRSGQS